MKLRDFHLVTSALVIPLSRYFDSLILCSLQSLKVIGRKLHKMLIFKN